MSTVIEARGFTLELPAAGYARPVLDRVTLSIERGTTLGIVGESGSGKSLLTKALLGDLPAGARTSGELHVAGTDVRAADPRQVRELRQRRIGMVFQDPKASVNPVHRIGDFLCEQVVRTGLLTTVQARARAIELLTKLRLHDPEAVLQRYPSELSGGMLQRVVIAAAMMSEPEILVCDEATTALDVTTQAEIVRILRELTADFGVTLIFVTHDLELAGDLCDRLCVLYAGQVLEIGPTRAVLDQPRHPYTAALLRSTPRLEGEQGVLPSIPGVVLPLTERPSGCVFADRCAVVSAACTAHEIPMRAHGEWSWRCLRTADAPEPREHDTEVTA